MDRALVLPVGLPFGLAQGSKGSKGTMGDRVRQPGTLHKTDHLVKGPACWPADHLHIAGDAGQTGTCYREGRQFHFTRYDRLDGTGDDLHRDAKRQESSEEHVTGHTGKGVDIEDAAIGSLHLLPTFFANVKYHHKSHISDLRSQKGTAVPINAGINSPQGTQGFTERKSKG
jgi:hypothetical protein